MHNALRNPQWLMLCPTCNTGQRGACDRLEQAESAIHSGFEQGTAPSTRLQRLRARSAAWLAALGVVALYALNGEPPPEILAAAYLPGDGFPAELLAVAFEPADAASEVQP